MAGSDAVDRHGSRNALLQRAIKQADSRHTNPPSLRHAAPSSAGLTLPTHTSNSKVLWQTLTRIGNLPEHAPVPPIQNLLHLQEVICRNNNLILFANSTSSLCSSSNLRLGRRLARRQPRLLRLESLLPLCMETTQVGMISGFASDARSVTGYVPTRREHWFPRPLYWQLVHSPLPSARSGTTHWAEGPSELGDSQDVQESWLVRAQKRWRTMARVSMEVR